MTSGRENGKPGAEGLSRRAALAMGLTAAGSLAAGFVLRGTDAAHAAPLRPPGALAEPKFLAACIRCSKCAAVCPNQCIEFFGVAAGRAAGTPLVRPREQACILCMKCTQACPTDALTPIADDAESVLKSVRMGTAEVREDLCYSYAGRTCGVCYYACPFPDKAIRLKHYAQPVVDVDNCVGCGNCERACIHLPQAIRVRPGPRPKSKAA